MRGGKIQPCILPHLHVGKRGGARVIYFYYQMDRPLYLLLAYAKAQAADLTAEEKRTVIGFAAVIKGSGI